MAAAFKPPRPRIRATRAETAERLLESAFDVFCDRGFEAASIEEICQRVGMTRGAFYSNYQSKEQLFCAASEQEARRFSARVNRLWIGVSAQPDPVSSAVERYALTELSDRRWYVFMSEFRLMAVRSPVIARRYTEIAPQIAVLLGQRLAELADSIGLKLTVSPGELGETWNAIAEAASWRLVLFGPPNHKPLVDALKQTLLRSTEPKDELPRAGTVGAE